MARENGCSERFGRSQDLWYPVVVRYGNADELMTGETGMGAESTSLRCTVRINSEGMSYVVVSIHPLLRMSMFVGFFSRRACHPFDVRKISP